MIPERLVIDTNIMMSALITPQGRVGRSILEVAKQSRLMACHHMYVELFHHKEKILKSNKLTESDFLELLLHLLNKCEFVNEERIAPDCWQRADQLVNDIDPKDTPFIALALHLNAPLWTGDRKLADGLRAKNFPLLITTAELNVV